MKKEEVLTYGLIKELIGDRNIPALKALIKGKNDDAEIERIVILDDYIAKTLWCREDVAYRLIEKGFAGTEEEVDEVLNSGELDTLGDCLDQHWEIINQAIDSVFKKEGI